VEALSQYFPYQLAMGHTGSYCFVTNSRTMTPDFQSPTVYVVSESGIIQVFEVMDTSEATAQLPGSSIIAPSLL